MEFNDVSNMDGKILFMSMFISKERKISLVKGGGIQYIYGHEETFIDFIINKYLPVSGNILDIGGGGLRFAIPAALQDKIVTVVDSDQDSLNVPDIVNRVNKNGKITVSLKKIQARIKTVKSDIFNYLEKTAESYSLISAFRVIHFFGPDEIEIFFRLISSKLDKDGIFAVSAMSAYNNKNFKEFNEFYLNSSAVYLNNELYRKFNSTLKADNIKKEQNLPMYLHFIDTDFISSKAEQYGFKVLERDILSTRVVNGYVLKKL